VSDANDAEVQIPEVDTEALEAAWRTGAAVLDVRNPDEYQEKHVPGAVLVPLPQLADRIGDVPEGRPLYVICARGGRSMQAAVAMRTQLGWDVVNVAGGTEAWANEGRPLATGDEPGHHPGDG
jgi:rhodanese-related sulfurtransferase